MITCLECGIEVSRLQWTHFKYKCTGKVLDSKQYLEKHPGARLVDEELAKKTAVTEENLVLKYGKQDGLDRWNSYKEKQSISNSFNYKQKNHGWTNNEFEEFNKSRASTLSNFVKRHGESVGIRKWDEYCERQRYTTSKEYYIEKYGNVDGIKRWREYCKDRAKASNIEFIMERYDLTSTGAESLLSERRSGQYVSNGERVFLEYIHTFLTDISYDYNNKQYCIWNQHTNSPMFYDATSTKRMKIIEYNGDYWHANPEKYEKDFVLKQSGASAEEIWERDRLKICSANDRGFEVFTVWENEFITNPETVKEKLTKWWNSEHKR